MWPLAKCQLGLSPAPPGPLKDKIMDGWNRGCNMEDLKSKTNDYDPFCLNPVVQWQHSESLSSQYTDMGHPC